jgi:hypothetical protein
VLVRELVLLCLRLLLLLPALVLALVSVLLLMILVLALCARLAFTALATCAHSSLIDIIPPLLL